MKHKRVRGFFRGEVSLRLARVSPTAGAFRDPGRSRRMIAAKLRLWMPHVARLVQPKRKDNHLGVLLFRIHDASSLGIAANSVAGWTPAIGG